MTFASASYESDRSGTAVIYKARELASLTAINFRVLQ
jgi:hypothetical protein